jgi:hypothetical protein
MRTRVGTIANENPLLLTFYPFYYYSLFSLLKRLKVALMEFENIKVHTCVRYVHTRKILTHADEKSKSHRVNLQPFFIYLFRPIFSIFANAFAYIKNFLYLCNEF